MEVRREIFVQDRIKENSKKVGNKAANQIELELLAKSITTQHIRVSIPQICTFEDQEVKSWLINRNFDLQMYWDNFSRAQGNSPALTP